jgi:hypothetical protein
MCSIISQRLYCLYNYLAIEPVGSPEGFTRAMKAYIYPPS